MKATYPIGCVIEIEDEGDYTVINHCWATLHGERIEVIEVQSVDLPENELGKTYVPGYMEYVVDAEGYLVADMETWRDIVWPD